MIRLVCAAAFLGVALASVGCDDKPTTNPKGAQTVDAGGLKGPPAPPTPPPPPR
jgi:hypothetical protein